MREEKRRKKKTQPLSSSSLIKGNRRSVKRAFRSVPSIHRGSYGIYCISRCVDESGREKSDVCIRRLCVCAYRVLGQWTPPYQRQAGEISAREVSEKSENSYFRERQLKVHLPTRGMIKDRVRGSRFLRQFSRSAFKELRSLWGLESLF